MFHVASVDAARELWSSTGQKWGASHHPSPPYETTQFTEPDHVAGATGVPACFSQRRRRSGPRTPASECALRPKMTKETPPLRMVGLRPIALSGPTWFAEVGPTTSMNWAVSTDSPSTREHARRPSHAQPAHGKGAFELIEDSGNRSELLSVELPYGVNRIPDPTDRGMP